MDILFVTPEIAPYSKVGGLADISAALPKALRGLGHRVTVLSPLYAGIDPAKHSLARRLSRLSVTLREGHTYECELYDGRTAAGIDLLFLGQPALFGRPGVYGEPPAILAYPDNAIRFGVFAKAAVEVARLRDGGYDVIHLNDWPAGLVPAYLHVQYAHVPRVARAGLVMSLHNLVHQGRFPKETLADLGLPWELFTPAGVEFYGDVSFLKAGLVMSDRITTASPTYAREILTASHGFGLEGVLTARKQHLVGILNGVDQSIWNAAADPNLVSRYDPEDLTGKTRCKADLQRTLELPILPDVPLIGTVSRLAWEKGLDVLAASLEKLLRSDVQVAVLGRGDPEVEAQMQRLAEQWRDRMAYVSIVDEKLAHQLYAGADLFVMPSRFEPCGLAQMYAQRYGTPPIVHATGGLIDTVVDCDAELRTGSGFVFVEDDPEELLAAMRRALAAYARTEAFRALRRRIMRIDHSWDRSARRYEQVYKAVLQDETP